MYPVWHFLRCRPSLTLSFVRSLVQIKSHAQKVLKRLESGEDVFGRLEENVSRLHTLVGQIHQANGLAPPIVILQPPSQPQVPQPPPRQSQQPLPKTETDAVAPTAASTTTVAQPASPAQPEAVATIETTTAADHGAANGSASAAPMGTATMHHPHKQRRLIKKKADGTAQHILAASALCQLAGPDSEGNASSGNNSISEGGEGSDGGPAATTRTDEDDPGVAMIAPDSKAGIVHEEGVDTETIMVAATGEEVVDALLEL